MNQAYVETLQKIENDPKLIRKKANELITDRVFLKEIIEYSIDNLLESAEAYYDDCDPNKLYYKVALKDKTRNFCFDIENFPHLLGLPVAKILFSAASINLLTHERTNSSNWLEVFKRVLKDHKDDIISYDSNTENINAPKLNWDKISEKVFAFLNLGILSNGETLYYRQNISPTKNKIKNFLLVRPLISKEIKGHLVVQFVLEEHDKQEFFVPSSIRFEETLARKPIINGIEYIFEGKAIIEQKEGGNYGRK